MASPHYTRIGCCLLLALVMLLTRFGSVLAPGTSLAAQSDLDGRARPHGPKIGQAVAVSRPKRHRHRRHHKKSSPGGAVAPAPAPVEPLRTSNCFSSPHSCGY